MSSASPALKTKVKVFLDNREMYETSEGEPQNPKWDNIWDLEIDILTVGNIYIYIYRKPFPKCF